MQGVFDRLRDGGPRRESVLAVTRLAIPDTMTKGAIDSFTRVLARPLGPRGLTVAPG
ncbi:hypothetical protein [Nocardia sp. A7]|uniref:hypothetical protein n=1 Tax=Nocardia sp. A7 TaxID=2789274 RepID=UPI0039794FEA